MRIARGLAVLPTALTTALAIAAITLAVRKALPDLLSNRRAWEILIGAIVIAVGAIAVAMARRLPPRAGTVALDQHHKLDGRLTNALAFVESAAEPTPLMEVAIDDACEHGSKLDPRRAAPIPVPHDLLGSVAAAAGVVAVALLHVPPKAAPPPPVAKQIDAVQMSPDDVELFRDAAKELAKKDQSPEVKAAIEKFNQLIEDIANKRLDRMEAFRRMEQIERELLSGQEADAKAFDEALKQTAEELKKSDLGKPVGESLEKKDFEKAKKDLKELAQSLKSGTKKPDKAALDKLRKALERAAAKKKEALAALNEKRNELREQLLQKKAEKKNNPDAGAPNPEDERLLKKKERELERLDREAERQMAAQRQLDRLDRELAKAAEDLLKDLGMSAEDLEQAAEDINRMQQEQMSDKEKEELRQRLQELREMLRQQGQGGQQRMARMLKFGKRARGGQGQKGQGQGQKGQGQDQDGQEGDDGQDGQGKDGQGKDGQGNMPGGQGGQKVLVLQKGAGSGPGQGPGQDGAGQPGQGDGQGGPGKGIGTQHDSNLTGKRTDMKAGTTDVQEQGTDTKQGPSNSEVILTAAERGFKGKGYKKVFTDYHTQAEKEINKDQVPDGYRFYVHRYFQLIRPRE
ncbi:MAG: hypothetical protein QM820_27775 [Minicystis sp.]